VCGNQCRWAPTITKNTNAANAKNTEVDLSEDDDRTEYRGQVDYDSGDSTEELLDQFQQIKSS